MENSGIQWTDHTWNPWRGCEKVSPGCDACYAEAMSHRNPSVLGIWGADGTRPHGNAAYMHQSARWNRAAMEKGVRERVFCGSLMDIWEDREDLKELRSEVLAIAAGAAELDWLFLSKRPQNANQMLAENLWLPGALYNELPSHWWFGATAEDRERLKERSDHLRNIPAKMRFLSCEPLLEDISDLLPEYLKGIGWVIVGGESNQGGKKARAFHIEWCEGIVNVCQQMGVPVFVKQFGSLPIADGLGLKLRDKHGGDMSEWPDWMRVRELPRAAYVREQG